MPCFRAAPRLAPPPCPAAGLAATVDSAARFDAELGLCRLVFDAEAAQTVCRLDDEFSAIYGHRIYLCKRLVPA